MKKKLFTQRLMAALLCLCMVIPLAGMSGAPEGDAYTDDSTVTEGDAPVSGGTSNGESDPGTGDGAGDGADAETPAEGEVSAETDKPEATDTVVETARVQLWSFANADAGQLSVYDEAYRVYPSGAPVTNNGNYASSTPDKAVDGDPATHWETGNWTSAPSYLEFTFPDVVNIGRLVYGTRQDGAAGKGFPHAFSILASQTESGEDFALVVQGGYETKTASYIEISFTEQSFRRLRFVFDNPAEGWASCREMMFYRADNSDTLLEGLFTDYCRLTLGENFNSVEKIQQLRAQVQAHPKYALSWKALLDRAEKVAAGELTFDERYELSTNPNAKNVIERNGDIVSYARNTLRFNSFTTNRQPSGVAAYAGDTITVYVDAQPGDKLPKIRFSQAYGYWSSWLGGELPLSIGANTFTVPNFKNANYTTRYVPAAGPIYIVNPYGPGEQSENVRIYIEGGDAYPVFHLGDDENAYKTELTAYADRVRSDADHVIDVTELVCNHAIMTVTATRADEIYDTASPQVNLQWWNKILRETLAFEGVKFDEADPTFDWRNYHLNVNYRVNQVWDGGYMFAYTEMIGLYAGADGENTLIYCLDGDGKPTIGWGLIHEMGHTTDLPDRTIGETTNNMPANFVNTYYNGQVRNNDYIAIAHRLASDRDWNDNGFNQNRYNYMIFFLLESYYQGYWGDTDNTYRYVDDRVSYAAMTKTERYIYFASLAAGVDLGYYFERWGFNLASTDPRFSRSTASAAYNTAMEAARQAGSVVVNELPIWYLDSAEYAYIRDNGLTKDKSGGVYYTLEGEKPASPQVVKTSDGYSLSMPVAGDKRHLGYEIWEGVGESRQRIGFTTGNAFTDTHPYESGYAPVYSVVAYDRVLSHTDFSDTAQTEAATAVCEVGGAVYDSLGAAIQAANAGDTVYLLKDITDSGIDIPKNLTITPKEGDVTIFRAGNAPVFRLGGSVNLKLVSSAGKTITLDGRNMSQDYPLIYMTDSATLDMTGGQVQNNVSRGYAAIAAVGWYSYVRVTGVEFVNNSGVNGGAIYTHGLYPKISGCTFTGNEATYGAAVYNCGGYLTIQDCTATGNTATYGGVLYSDGQTVLSGGSYTDNTATYGGVAAVCPSGYSDVRTVSVTNGARFAGNRADKGNLLYLRNSGRATLTKAVLEDQAAQGQLIYMDSGLVTVDGSQTEFTGAVYLNNGKLSFLNQLPQSGPITVTLGQYSAADPIVATDFAVTEEDMTRVVMTDGKYHLQAGPDGQSLYLTMSYTVTLDPAGGTILKRNLTGYVQGETTVLPTAADIVKTGSSFVGWYENGNFNTNSVKSIKPEDSGNKKYTALWTTTSYWIQYVLNGGKFTGDVVSHYEYSPEGSVQLSTAAELSREGREFMGWYRTAQLDKSAQYPEPVTEFDLNLNKNLTFYAKWSCAPGAPVRENDTAPSCTQPGGYDLVTYCMDKDCVKELSREHVTVEALGHSWSDWEEANGLRTRRCSTCGAEETENLVPDGHVAPADFTVDVAPTCDSDGSASKRCVDCGLVLETKVLPATGHAESPALREKEVPATCEEPGSYQESVYCLTCGKLLRRVTVEVPAAGHDFGDWENLKSLDGSPVEGRRHQCRVCGFIEMEGVEDSQHRWADDYTVDQEADCTRSGSRSIHCLDCTAVKDAETIPAAGHTEGAPLLENVRPATCTQSGSYLETVNCSVCGAFISRQTVTRPATGHIWGGWTSLNTAACGGTVTQVRVCLSCGLEEYDNLVLSGHRWDSGYTVDLAPTCVSEGRESVHCAVCGVKKDSRSIPATGHKAGEVTRENEREPGCVKAGGYDEVTRCLTCGEVIQRLPVTVPAQGHDFVDVYPDADESAVQRICSRCGAIEPEHEADSAFAAALAAAGVDRESLAVSIPTADAKVPAHRGVLIALAVATVLTAAAGGVWGFVTAKRRRENGE